MNPQMLWLTGNNRGATILPCCPTSSTFLLTFGSQSFIYMYYINTAMNDLFVCWNNYHNNLCNTLNCKITYLKCQTSTTLLNYGWGTTVKKFLADYMCLTNTSVMAWQLTSVAMLVILLSFLYVTGEYYRVFFFSRWGGGLDFILLIRD